MAVTIAFPILLMNWKRTFFFAFVAQFLGIVGLSFATPFLPFYIADLGIQGRGAQAFWAGMAMAAGGFTFALLAPVWGMFADRFGRKPMLCRAMFGAALSVLLMSFARNVHQLVLFRIIQGAFSGTLAASIALVASVTPVQRSGFALGLMQAAVFIGNALGPLLGGVAADHLGYRASFRCGALLILLGGIMVLFGTQERFRSANRKTNASSPGFRKIILLPGFLLSVMVLFGVRLGNSISNPSFPLIVGDILESGRRVNSVTGMVIGSAALAAAAAAAILGHLGDRLGRRQVLICCCLGACISSAAHYFVRDLPSLFVVRIMFGFSVAGMMPAANAMINEMVDPRSIGKAYGLATSLSMLGAAVGPSLGGTLAMHVGLRIPFLVTGAAQLVLVMMIFRFLPASRPARGVPDPQERV